jgi:drug/metabolite transporter (DMT)-like permease
VLLPFIVLFRASWPRRDQWVHVAISGLLVHAGYLSGVWCAVKLGMPAGLSALIVNLQPIVTGVAGPWLGERVSRRQWLGLLLGFAGVALVVGHKLSVTGLSPATVWLSVFALLSISLGTLYQKKRVPTFDLRTGTFVQYLACLAVVWPLSLWLEDEAFRWNGELVFALAWSVFALSIGAIFLMFTLIARGAATRVASLFYLVPPCTVLLAWLLFGESFGAPALAGMAITAIGVALVQRR